MASSETLDHSKASSELRFPDKYPDKKTIF